MDNVSNDVFISAQRQLFLATRWVSAHNADFWHKTKNVISIIAFLKCQSPVAVQFPSVRPARPGFVLTTISQCCRSRVLRTGHAPLRANPWQVLVLFSPGSVTQNPLACYDASTKRKSTNISLIRAFGISPSKPVYVSRSLPLGLCPVWPRQSSQPPWDREQGQIRSVPNTHFFHHTFLTKDTGYSCVTILGFGIVQQKSHVAQMPFSEALSSQQCQYVLF